MTYAVWWSFLRFLIKMRTVILTQGQAALLLQEQTMARLLQESIGDREKFKVLKNTVLKFLAGGMAATAVLLAIESSNLPANNKQELSQVVKEHEDSMHYNRMQHTMDSIYAEKVKECRRYMEWALNNQGYTLESTELKPETLVNASIKYSFDLPFLMAVAHQESCFGATPRARRTNSVFSEGSYDNGHNAVRYNDPNESVYGYINLMESDYLINGKGLSDLLIPGGFVNHNGHRYASDRNYENKIKYLRNRIVKEYPNLT